MKKYIVWALFVFILSTCSSINKGDRDYIAPEKFNNACDILYQNQSWRTALIKTKHKWNVAPAIIMAIIYQESRFKSQAQPAKRYKFGFIPVGQQSSAYGYPQAIDSTWNWYRKHQQRPKARRDRFVDAVDFIGWYMHRTYKANHIMKHDAYNQYLAYHEGHTGYRRGLYRKKLSLKSNARALQKRAKLYQKQLWQCL